MAHGSAGCSGILTDPGAEGGAHLYLLLDQDAPCGGFDRGDRLSTDASAHGRLTINFHSLRRNHLALVTFAVEKMIVCLKLAEVAWRRSRQ